MATTTVPPTGFAAEGAAHSAAVESVVCGNELIPGAEDLTDSWRRSATQFRIDIDGLRKPNILTPTEIKTSREPLGNVIAHSQEEIDRLYAIVRQEGAVVLLCSRQGTAVHHRGDEARKDQFQYWGIWEGGVWSEEIEGTNGIGTCIAEERPVSVYRGEHFRTRHTGLSCAGAPIFDARGELVSVLDTSSITSPTSDESPSLSLAATVASGRAIEERLFRDSFPRAWIVAAVPFDGSSPAVLLAVDNDQRVVGADRAACLAFAITDQGLIEGIPLSTRFEYHRGLFRWNKGEDVAARLMPSGGSGWWHVLITPPSSSPGRWRSHADAEIHSLPRLSRLGSLPIPELGTPHHGGLPPALTQRIREYIDAHLHEKVTLEAMAETAGLSPHHFARAFRQSVGMPPHQYLLQRRLDAAERMLRNTDLPLSEIALRSGFSDQSHLARHFRRLTGLPPSELRWRNR
jgi:AraC-like DNA-binding protein/PAS domain-containing protein